MAALAGSVAIVTGAGRGIGRTIAEELSRSGARVVVNYAHSREQAEQLVAQLREQGHNDAVALQADVALPDQAARLIEETVSRFNRIDVLVNNAGVNVDKTLKNLTVEDWERVIQTDLNSCFYTVKAASPHFIRQEAGAIVNISSFVGQMGNFGQSNYAAAKAGIIGFTKAAALELARYNVTVNAVCPGFIQTDMFENVPEEARQKILQRIPLRRIGRPEEVARAVRYLIEDGAYITGQTLNINGGIYM
jgi:acetoacetyl-CoA reductase